ncbi:unnamed protein product [Calypogeia fissa]
MAVCGLLSMLCVSPIQPDMDSCPGHSSGATRNHLKFWQSGVGPRASSCLSSTMVDRNDPDDSGSSQPPTPTRTRSESKSHMVIRDSSLPGHELELSISLNDAQRSTPSRSKSLKDEFDLTSATTVGRDDTFGRSGGLEEETSFSGPPRKRARMSPIGFRLEETQAENVREQQQRYPLVSTSSVVTGVHSLLPSRSLPSFRSTEREPSPSPSRGASTSWWLGPGPKNSAMIPNEIQQGFQSSVQEPPPRGNFSIDGRGMIPGTSLQERDFPFKEPSYYPNMLSSMETSEQVRRGEDALSPAGARPKEQPGRPQMAAALQDPPEHSFFSRKESSTSRLSSITSTVSEETVPRSGSTFLAKNREASFPQDTNTLYGQQTQQQHPFELQGVRRRYTPASESPQHVDLEREPPQDSFVRPQQVDQQRALPHSDQRSLHGPPGGNANTTFYARILDAAQQPAAANPFSEGGGYPGVFNTTLGFNLVGHSLPPRPSSQPGAGPVQFGGEASNSNLAHQQQANSEVLRNLLIAQPRIPYMAQQLPSPDPVRLSFPNLSSLDFLQSLQQQQQRQSFPPQGTDRHRPVAPPGQVAGSHPPPQGFSFLGGSQSSQHTSLPAELHLPRSSQPGNMQVSAGLRDFLSPQAPKGVSSLGLGRGPVSGPHEIPTHLSLQAPAPPPLTVVMEGRSIGRRISLNDFDGYDSFAASMRTMFNSHVALQERPADEGNCTLANAIPGYVIAYEDEEGDVLLAGDLPWRDFVRMAKQIRIVPSSKISFRLPTGRLQRKSDISICLVNDQRSRSINELVIFGI